MLLKLFHRLLQAAYLLTVCLFAAPALAQTTVGLCVPDRFVILPDGTPAKVDLITSDGLCQLTTAASRVEFLLPDSLTSGDEDTYRAARRAIKEAREAEAAAATHTIGQPPTACTIGLPVTGPNAKPGMITGGRGGFCTVRITGGDITVWLLEQMLATAGGPMAPPVLDGIMALTEGYWTCAPQVGEGFDLFLTPFTYATMAGESGRILPYGDDPLAVTFADGPYDGHFGAVTAGKLFFTTPGGENLTCLPRG